MSDTLTFSLLDLGFDHLYSRSRKDVYQDADGHTVIVPIASGHVILEFSDGYEVPVALPSEAFFDQLLTALGWTP